MSNYVTISISEDGDHSEVSRTVGSVDPFGSLVDAFCDAVKAAGYGDDSRFVALGYYWEALDESFDATAGEPEDEPVEDVAWDGEYRVGDVVRIVDHEWSWYGSLGKIVENDGELELPLRVSVGDSGPWWLDRSDVEFISRPTTA